MSELPRQVLPGGHLWLGTGSDMQMPVEEGIRNTCPIRIPSGAPCHVRSLFSPDQAASALLPTMVLLSQN